MSRHVITQALFVLAACLVALALQLPPPPPPLPPRPPWRPDAGAPRDTEFPPTKAGEYLNWSCGDGGPCGIKVERPTNLYLPSGCIVFSDGSKQCSAAR